MLKLGFTKILKQNICYSLDMFKLQELILKVYMIHIKNKEESFALLFIHI